MAATDVNVFKDCQILVLQRHLRMESGSVYRIEVLEDKGGTHFGLGSGEWLF